jgi:hypothetical protein
MVAESKTRNLHFRNEIPFHILVETVVLGLFFFFSSLCRVIIVPPMLHSHIPLTCHRRSVTVVTVGLVTKTLHLSLQVCSTRTPTGTLTVLIFRSLFPSQQQILRERFICRPVLISSKSLKKSYVQSFCDVKCDTQTVSLTL